jgi:GNAT superfamily N-acetyltransferase
VRTDTDTETRAWADGDLHRLQEAESSFSAQTLARRFLSGNHRFPLAYLAALRRLDPADRSWLGHVALADGRLIGLAECAWATGSPRTAELAILVADGWQRRGVGRALVTGLLRQCELAGITRVGAVASTTNPGPYGLVRSLERRPAELGNWSLTSSVSGVYRRFALTLTSDRVAAAGPATRRGLSTKGYRCADTRAH